MLIENNKTLTSLVIVYISFVIIESLFGLLSSYVMVPMMEAKSGTDGLSGYYRVQSFIYSSFNIISFILLLVIGIQLKHSIIRILLFILAFLQLGWAIYPFVRPLFR
jgi:hypothetical protein